MSVFFSFLLGSSWLLFSWKFWASLSVLSVQSGDCCLPCPRAGTSAVVVSEPLPPHSCRKQAPCGPPALPTAVAPPLACPAGNRSSTSAEPPLHRCAACAGSPAAAACGLQGQRGSSEHMWSSLASAPSFLLCTALW